MKHRAGIKLISAAMAAVMFVHSGAPLAVRAAQADVYRQVAELLDTVQPQDVAVEYTPAPQQEPAPAATTSQPEGGAQPTLQVDPQQTPAAPDTTPAPGPETTPAPSALPAASPEPVQSPAPTPAASAEAAPAQSPVPSASPAPAESPVPSTEPAPAQSPEPSASPAPAESPDPGAAPAEGESDEIATSENTQTPDVPGLYEGGVILISSYAQLQQLASGAPLTDADGNAVLDADGAPVTYAADGQYAIAQDIELPEGGWLPPEGFTGRIAPRETAADCPLYDAASDTIYIYHTLQLAVLAQPNAGEEPVMNNDADPALFGVGQMIWPDGEEQPYLTYGAEHRYVLSTQFTTDLPEEMPGVNLMEDKVPVPGTNYEGRDFPGQVVKTIDGVHYILIGNEEQLRAIGTDADVNAAVYQAKSNLVGKDWQVDTTDDDKLIMLYGGDADLDKSQNGTKDYDFGEVERASGAYTGRCGVDQATGQIDANLDIENSCYGLKYTADANYIIFRDITLTGGDWTPIEFSGTMIGAKADSAESKATLWQNNTIQGGQPAISNITINQTDDLNVDEYIGVGFFATLSSDVTLTKLEDDSSVLGSSKTTVENVGLKNVSVNTSDDIQVKQNQGLLGILLSLVAGLVGVILAPLLSLIGLGSVSDLLQALLDTRKNDPSAFATGAFAGRIVGFVEVKNCTVSNVSINSKKTMTGGFAGYVVGETSYVTEVLGEVLEGLQTLLDYIPFLGLGDLIGLLNNVINLGQLIPYSYDAPVLSGCVVEGLTGTIGYAADDAPKTEYSGGFVGQMIGARALDCHVKNSSYTVSATKYGGGFVGLARDAEIKGALANLGIELVRVGQPESLLLNCSVESPAGDLHVAGSDYIGGFAGALANSYTVNCAINMQQTDNDSQTVARALSVNGSGNNIGGWAGIGTIGWVTNLGGSLDNSVLANLKDAVLELLGGENAGSLLSLIGVAPSAIMGCQINGGSGVTVKAGGQYAGGFVGSGDGLYLTSSSQANLQNLSFWRAGSEDTLNYPEQRDNSITNLTSVSADEYAGGIAGSLRTASIAGLLNNVAGVGSYLPFTVQGTQVSGGKTGYTVSTAANYAGGGFGELLGGSVGCAYTGDEETKTPVEDSGVYLTNLASVTAHNVAGGFAAVAGPGELAGASGLELDILGLKLLEVKNLLSLAEGVEVTLTDCTVTGIEGGYTVAATGQRTGSGDITEFLASGFLARSNSTTATDCHAVDLKNVTAANAGGYAGGFLATSRVGGLAQAGADGSFTEADENVIGTLIETDGLLSAIGYLIPTYTNCTVTYADLPAAEQADAAPAANVQAEVAGGFAADFQSGTVDNSARGEDDRYAVYNLANVAGQTYAGGFAGKLYSGALAEAGKGISILGNIASINVSDLLSVAQAYVPIIVGAGVKSCADGFAVSASKADLSDPDSGSAGGFAGYASGAQISQSDVNKLVHTTVVDQDPLDPDAYGGTPVYYEKWVETVDKDEPSTGDDPAAKAGKPEDPEDPDPDAPDDPEDLDKGEEIIYESFYAVTAGRYAGGYVGKADIGSAASVGKGLSIMEGLLPDGDGLLGLNSLLSALDTVVTTIEHSDVYGAAGGYAVRATAGDGTNGYFGHAGGFAGVLYGGHIQDSHAHNFSHIIGRESAGGYVGEMKPGNVAEVLGDDTSVINQLANVQNLLSGLQVFVPTIRNSSTDSVPCGGVVWAQVSGEQAQETGMAGGYVGHNEGGQIRGLDTEYWNPVTVEGGEIGSDDPAESQTYTGPTSLCQAVRIRTVYGTEYAGGYTGFMETADMAETGNLSLLGGLIQVSDPLSVLQIVYPIQTNTAVYGPLADLDVETWNKWVGAVGVNGGYGFELAQAGQVATQDDLNAKLANYIYGYDVITGSDAYAEKARASAGGYVGLMRSGVLTNCMAYDAKSVQAPGAAGGFAGRAEAGGAASFGSASILGLDLEIGKLVDVAELFVPAINNSSVQGYRSGLTVTATGTPAKNQDIGYAGGYIGAAYGAQIQKTDTVANITPENDLPTGDDIAKWAVYPDAATYPTPAASCDVRNLRRVAGRSAVGGYVGLASAGSLASVNTNAGDGLLQGILDSVIGSVGDLLDLLPATVTTIYKGSVSPADPDWGFVVDGAYTNNGVAAYADYAGGFAGALQAASLGYDANAVDHKDPGELTVTGLRQVDGGLYAGGFVGLADVNAVAQVGGNTADGEKTTVLDSLLGGLVGLGNIDAADFIRTYIYHASVDGVDEGYRVQAHTAPQNHEGTLGETRWAGCAGGFAGAVLNGTVGSSTAANVATVKAPNYTGGFVGHMGKSGIVDVDSVDLLSKLLGTTVGVVDLFGTQVQDCTVTGYAQGADTGIEVIAQGGQQPIAGGFAGYADLGRIDRCHVGTTQPQDGAWDLTGNLKLVQSDQVAGGFIGQTDMAYLVSAEVNSWLVRLLLTVVGEILEELLALSDDQLESGDIITIKIELLGLIEVKVLDEGNLLTLELLGLPVTISLNKNDLQANKKGVVVVTIGDSEIKLNYTADENGDPKLDFSEESSDITINLIKGNRTEIDACTVTGIADGYDVFGGGAGQTAAATCQDKTGSAGGFVGYNHEGKISNSTMYYCDVVKGTAEYVGPFTGLNDLRSVYFFNNITDLEGEGNRYSIYRANDPSLAKIVTSGGQQVGDDAVTDTAAGATYDRYDIDHIVDFADIVDTDQEDAAGNKGATVQDTFKALDGAVMTNDAAATSKAPALAAYQANGAKAVLMLDTPNTPNPGTTVPEPGEGADPCLWNVDLTVNKVWDDWFDFEQARPESVTLQVIQHKYVPDENAEDGYREVITEAGVTPQYPNTYEKITLTADDRQSAWSSVWSKVLQDAPVVAFNDANGNGVWDDDETITAYYVYTVEEPKVPNGYEASIDNYDPDDAGGYELTVTNKRPVELPNTGAAGDAMFVAVGVGLLLLGLARIRRRPRKGER